ncbi:probable LRR receptor-like serine/threonine-protein kinase At3g47570 isoform X2 [Jatropha curcas]|uniref:probable LRR receptor-like serine/threonine-protein kinase At3g47570 isoform X2 n=1 Tax=Jatropha curcas TaxID=180498 RepID=UPI0009D70B84|nr:probable LRR receptor-like serine/threonine-protein kinase At3g47570 isoform X2 [Jatropha curcas]
MKRSCAIAIIRFFCFSLPTCAMIYGNNETDRLALLEFKSKITDDPLGVMTSWNASFHFCQWYGVQCVRRHQRVTVLDLRSLKLSGSISPHIGNLSFLRELFLQNNSFTQEIPHQISHLLRLQTLFLHNNSIEGELPCVILTNCSNLVSINLARNKLVGEVPCKLGSSLKLKYMRFGKNNLTGTLPPSLGNLSSLQYFSVNGNQLRGNLPHTFGKLKNLKDLIFSSNQFSVSNASNLQSLQLSINDLTGAVPSFEKLQSLYFLTMSENHLGSSATGKPNNDDLKFLSTLTNATILRLISIGQNNFGGELPQETGNLSKKLEAFDLGGNQIFGNIPAGLFSLESLQVFNASSNRFWGTIPHTIGKLQNLRLLYLDYNQFMGSIPSSIGNLTNLLQIDLSDNNFQGIIPSSLGNCETLISIDLSRNNFSGSIPSKLFQLSSLSLYFGLSGNRLSGSFSNEVGNLKNLQRLELGNNMLSGNIPTSLGSCVILEFLDISRNNFQGSIPSSLISLRGIVELNVSHNNLSGKIPEFLKAFNSTQTLDLSYNDFEGMVPTQGIFKNASATSIAGNKRLCGGIPEFGLPACNSEEQNKRMTIKLKIIISTVSVITSVALVLVCLFLCYSRKKKEGSASTPFGNAPLNLSYQSLLKATNGFSSNNLIGTGGSGSVYKGVLDPEGIVIAVKVLDLQRRGASKSFLAECAAIRNIRHRNLVKVLTACSSVDYQGNDFKALVYEFMSNGSLDDWLHPILGPDEVPRTLNVLQRLNIAIDVACALEYLHLHCGAPIVHCDLKPNNILLDEEMTAHVSDFGLAKFLADDRLDSANQFSSLGLRGTIGYCPPEYGVAGEVSTSGDIFSFGILLLEMFTGKRPTDDMFKENLSLHNFVKEALLEHVAGQVIDLNLLHVQLNVDVISSNNQNFSTRGNNILIECLVSILEIGVSCSVEFPQERMNIGDVVAQLSSVRNKLLGSGLFQGGEVRNALQLY